MTIQPNPAPLSPTKDPEKKKKDTFLESSNLLFVKEHPAGSRKPYWFEPDNIRDEKRETFLILGFDTEYKAPDDKLDRTAVRAGNAKYHVLSYQFHCLNEAGFSCSGVCCPDGPLWHYAGSRKTEAGCDDEDTRCGRDICSS